MLINTCQWKLVSKNNVLPVRTDNAWYILCKNCAVFFEYVLSICGDINSGNILSDVGNLWLSDSQAYNVTLWRWMLFGNRDRC